MTSLILNPPHWLAFVFFMGLILWAHTLTPSSRTPPQ